MYVTLVGRRDWKEERCVWAEAVVITQPPAPCNGKRVAGRSEEAAVQERALAWFRLGGSPADPGHHLEGPQNCRDNTLE